MRNKNFVRKKQAIYISPNKKSTRIIKTLMDFFFFIKIKIKMVCFSVPSTSLRGGTVGRSAWSMGGGFGMALIPLTSAGMLLGVAGVFPFAPVMTQLFPVGTSTACADSCVRASGGAAGAVFCFRMAFVPLTGAGMGAVAIGSPRTPVMVQSRTGDLCEFSFPFRI